MTTYKMKFEVNETLAEVRLNAFLPNGEKFASHSLTNDEVDWVEPNEHEHTHTELIDYVHTCVPESEAESLYEFLGSLDTYAKQHAEQSKKVWACRTCGATTTDPTHSLITYFHKDCQGVA